jgi:hypothetical protein
MMIIEMTGASYPMSAAKRRRRAMRLAAIGVRMLSGNPTEGVYSMYVSTIAVETGR